jgi:hypothetical protein
VGEAEAVSTCTKAAKREKINQLQEIIVRCWRHIRNLALTMVSTERKVILLRSFIAGPALFALSLTLLSPAPLRLDKPTAAYLVFQFIPICFFVTVVVETAGG